MLSPKVHFLLEIVPETIVEVLVNCALIPKHNGELTVKEATGLTLTVTIFINVSFSPMELVTISRTLNSPVSEKEWTGFCNVEVALSPKFQLYETSVPDKVYDASVKTLD